MLAVIRDTIRLIPRGKVSSYGEVASAAGLPGRARQVVWALRGARGVPWHRVVGAGGKIMLPGENGLEQRMRLETEGVAFRGGRVWMEQHRFEFPSAAKSPKTKRAPKAKPGPAARRKRTK
jgi:methylated-DNA-protein-cysteine methyltransferase related protein